MSNKPKCSLEERITELLEEDFGKGANKIFEQLTLDGYKVKKHEVRALKNKIVSKATIRPSTMKNQFPQKSEDTHDDQYIHLIAQKCPEKQRVFCVPNVLANKEKGNEAFKKKEFDAALSFYTLAFSQTKSDSVDGCEEVHLWQLYSNLSAAKMKTGVLYEALQDAISCNTCAPAEEEKPILRCAEALAAMGFFHEANELLFCASQSFSMHSERFLLKSKILSPRATYKVGGGDCDFKTISEAILFVSAGSEIIVEPGIYEETLFITKPLTFRSSNGVKQIKAETNCSTHAWPVIQSPSMNSITCAVAERSTPVHFIGFTIKCKAPLIQSYHAICVKVGTVVIRDCVLTSNSGPIACADGTHSNLIIQSSLVCQGLQGGIICVDGGHASIHNTQCMGNAAMGLELRENGSASVTDSHFGENGRQGIMSWMGAGKLDMKGCEIFSQQNESGILISEAEASLEKCKIYNNRLAGVVSQQKGYVQISKSEVYGNNEGILIQDTGSGKIKQCEVYSNTANGIFVGMDFKGSVALIENDVHDNRYKGILLGSTRNVKIRGNKEYGNEGKIPLPPGNPKTLLSGRRAITDKYMKRLEKNMARGHCDEYKKGLISERILKDCGIDTKEFQNDLLDHLKKNHERCSYCDLEENDSVTLSKCNRCKVQFYCSRDCQVKDWPRHKNQCFDAKVKYPTFLDNNTSV